MFQKLVSNTDKIIYQESKIPFSKIVGQSKLFVDYQDNSDKINQFYPNKDTELKDFVKEIISKYEVDREVLCDILLDENKDFNAGTKTFDNIKKLRSNDCVAVLTGQQAGLFSGPLYTFYKAFSAIKLASDLNEQGISAVPIFWIASEDHDFDEISKTFFIDESNDLHKCSYEPFNSNEHTPIGLIEIDSNINDTLNELISSLPKTEFTEKITEQLRESYKPGETLSSAFGKMIARLFKDYGLIFVSPINKRLRNLCSPIYTSAIRDSSMIVDKLIECDEELKAKNYHSQVLVEKDFFPFFYIDKDKHRNSLRFNDDYKMVISQNNKHQFTVEDLIKIAENSPQKLSPNALMRPIVQDYLFPTICYFGGGAEIAYFAQNSVIYDCLDRPNTPIRHRSSFTIVQGKHRRTLSKYELNFTKLFEGIDKILAEIIEEHLNPETANLFASSEELIEKQFDLLDKNLKQVDPTLSDNLANRRKKIIWHIEALRKKYHRAETVKNEVINRRIQHLFESVLPNEHLQERTLNILTFLNLYGDNFIDWIYNAVDSDIKDHQLIIF